MSPAMRPTTRKAAAQSFPISVNLEFTLRSSGTRITGRGRTLTLSANGFTFACGESLPPEGTITFSVAWPIKLNGSVDLNLCGRGRFIRSGRDHATVEFLSYEFRTRSAKMFESAEPESHPIVRSTYSCGPRPGT
jgi:hypothetical protein